MPTVLSKLGQFTQLGWEFRPQLRDVAPALVGTGALALVIHLYRKHYQLVDYSVKYGRGAKQSVENSAAAAKGGDGGKAAKAEGGGGSGGKVRVNLALVKKLWRIVRILIPSACSAEMFYMLMIAMSLLARTYADVWMIETSTGIEASIISRKRSHFYRSVLHYLLCMPLVSVVNALLRLGLSELKLRFRERLTHHLYRSYLADFTFYKMSNLDSRIANADQLLTTDVEKFCDGIVDLYANVSKPLVDVALFVWKIGGALGFSAPSRLFVYLLASGAFLTHLRRAIGPMTVREQQLEGEFRHVNARLITNAEEVAFYQGEERERLSIMAAFQRMVQHLRRLILLRFRIGFLDNIVAKYVATVVGWYTMSRPFLDKSNRQLMAKSRDHLMQDYYNSGRMMFKLAEALGRLALAGREMTRLAGYTQRVELLMHVLDDVHKGQYQRTMVVTANQGSPAPHSAEKLESIEENSDKATATSSSSTTTTTMIRHQPPKLGAGGGRITIADKLIKFHHVPLVTPNGDVLIESLDFEVPSGTNVLVCGPNGCGKSSLFRVLGELWPLWGGELTKPERGRLFYVPQRPYMTLGTLRDQIIYPDRPAEMRRRGYRDSDLAELLAGVQLSYLLQRDGGLDAQHDWMDVLSGGEKQRVAMARLFYHRPQFAILDECTSAVSADVEGTIYSRCHSLGITLFTVSHRKSLWKHHDYYLQMDGRGSYRFGRIDDGVEEFGS